MKLAGITVLTEMGPLIHLNPLHKCKGSFCGQGVSLSSRRCLSYPISTSFPGIQRHNIQRSNQELGLIIWGHRGYRMCFTSNHRKLAVAVQVNSLHGISSKPCLLPPHPKAMEPVFQLSGSSSYQRSQKCLPLMHCTASGSCSFIWHSQLSVWTLRQQFCASWRTPYTLWRPFRAQVSGGIYRKKKALSTKQEIERRDPIILTLLVSESLQSCYPPSFSNSGRPPFKALTEKLGVKINYFRKLFPFMPPLLNRNCVSFLCRWRGIIKRKGNRFPSGSLLNTLLAYLK